LPSDTSLYIVFGFHIVMEYMRLPLAQVADLPSRIALLALPMAAKCAERG